MDCVARNWYFVIGVREGLPGCADDDTYQSANFKSFEDCYRRYINFSPAKYWKYLRGVRDEYIVYQHDDVTTKNRAHFGMVYYIPDQIVKDLGITEEQFDTLIDELQA